MIQLLVIINITRHLKWSTFCLVVNHTQAVLAISPGSLKICHFPLCCQLVFLCYHRTLECNVYVLNTKQLYETNGVHQTQSDIVKGNNFTTAVICAVCSHVGGGPNMYILPQQMYTIHAS